jgi:hypothetical protein
MFFQKLVDCQRTIRRYIQEDKTLQNLIFYMKPIMRLCVLAYNLFSG